MSSIIIDTTTQTVQPTVRQLTVLQHPRAGLVDDAFQSQGRSAATTTPTQHSATNITTAVSLSLFRDLEPEPS